MGCACSLDDEKHPEYGFYVDSVKQTVKVEDRRRSLELEEQHMPKKFKEMKEHFLEEQRKARKESDKNIHPVKPNVKMDDQPHRRLSERIMKAILSHTHMVDEDAVGATTRKASLEVQKSQTTELADKASHQTDTKKTNDIRRRLSRLLDEAGTDQEVVLDSAVAALALQRQASLFAAEPSAHKRLSMLRDIPDSDQKDLFYNAVTESAHQASLAALETSDKENHLNKQQTDTDEKRTETENERMEEDAITEYEQTSTHSRDHEDLFNSAVAETARRASVVALQASESTKLTIGEIDHTLTTQRTSEKDVNKSDATQQESEILHTIDASVQCNSLERLPSMHNEITQCSSASLEMEGKQIVVKSESVEGEPAVDRDLVESVTEDDKVSETVVNESSKASSTEATSGSLNEVVDHPVVSVENTGDAYMAEDTRSAASSHAVDKDLDEPVTKEDNLPPPAENVSIRVSSTEAASENITEALDHAVVSVQSTEGTNIAEDTTSVESSQAVDKDMDRTVTDSENLPPVAAQESIKVSSTKAASEKISEVVDQEVVLKAENALEETTADLSADKDVIKANTSDVKQQEDTTFAESIQAVEKDLDRPVTDDENLPAVVAQKSISVSSIEAASKSISEAVGDAVVSVQNNKDTSVAEETLDETAADLTSADTNVIMDNTAQDYSNNDVKQQKEASPESSQTVNKDLDKPVTENEKLPPLAAMDSFTASSIEAASKSINGIVLDQAIASVQNIKSTAMVQEPLQENSASQDDISDAHVANSEVDEKAGFDSDLKTSEQILETPIAGKSQEDSKGIKVKQNKEHKESSNDEPASESANTDDVDYTEPQKTTQNEGLPDEAKLEMKVCNEELKSDVKVDVSAGDKSISEVSEKVSELVTDVPDTVSKDDSSEEKSGSKASGQDLVSEVPQLVTDVPKTVSEVARSGEKSTSEVSEQVPEVPEAVTNFPEVAESEVQETEADAKRLSNLENGKDDSNEESSGEQNLENLLISDILSSTTDARLLDLPDLTTRQKAFQLCHLYTYYKGTCDSGLDDAILSPPDPQPDHKESESPHVAMDDNPEEGNIANKHNVESLPTDEATNQESNSNLLTNSEVNCILSAYAFGFDQSEQSSANITSESLYLPHLQTGDDKGSPPNVSQAISMEAPSTGQLEEDVNSCCNEEPPSALIDDVNSFQMAQERSGQTTATDGSQCELSEPDKSNLPIVSVENNVVESGKESKIQVIKIQEHDGGLLTDSALNCMIGGYAPGISLSEKSIQNIRSSTYVESLPPDQQHNSTMHDSTPQIEQHDELKP